MTSRIWFSLLILTPLVGVGCKRETPKAGQPNPAEVDVASPVTKQVTDYEFFTGRTEPPERAELKSNITGYLIEADTTADGKVKYKEGGKVKKGDVLFIIDPKINEAELAVAKANLGLARARLKRADDDLQRGIELGGAISKEEMDKRRADFLEATEALTVAQATVNRATINLNYTQVRAPFDGTVGRRMVDPGSTIKANETVLTVLVSDGPMYAYFDVDERTLLSQLLKTSALGTDGMDRVKVDLALADEDDFPHQGTVNFIDNRVDPGTGSKWMRAQFDNPNRPLTPGLFVRVRFPLGKPYEALLVAEQAVGTDQGQKFVYVVDDKGKVEYRRVSVGRLQGGLRVIRPYKDGATAKDREGLKPKERIVVSGLQRVKPDDVVKPKDGDMMKKVLPDRTGDPGPLPPPKKPEETTPKGDK